MYFCRFFVNNFDFLTQRARKNDFNIKLMSETCSGTSNNVYLVCNIMTLEYVLGLMWRDICSSKVRIFATFLEGISALRPWAIFGLLSPLQKWFFDMGDNFEGPIKSAQGKNFEIFSRNFSKNF